MCDSARLFRHIVREEQNKTKDSNTLRERDRTEGPYRSNSSLITSTISSGNACIFFPLRSMVRPGLRELLTPLASAALASFSRAALIASRASTSTWLGEMGCPAERFEDEGTSRRLGTGGGGVGFASSAAARARRACAGLSGSPRGMSIESGRNGPPRSSVLWSSAQGESRRAVSRTWKFVT